MKKKNNNLDKQYYLKVYLQKRNQTLKDLKCEVILMFCGMLINEYIKIENTENSELLIDDYYPFDDNKYILNILKEMNKNIITNCFTIEKILEVLINQNQDNESLLKANLIEALYFYYNICVNAMKSTILKKNKPNDSIRWMPDLICFTLINDMLENNYTFNKFSFIKNYDFENILRIYSDANIIIKKQKNISLLSKEQTVISEMMNISSEIVTKLINTKYK